MNEAAAGTLSTLWPTRSQLRWKRVQAHRLRRRCGASRFELATAKAIAFALLPPPIQGIGNVGGWRPRLKDSKPMTDVSLKRTDDFQPSRTRSMMLSSCGRSAAKGHQRWTGGHMTTLFLTSHLIRSAYRRFLQAGIRRSDGTLRAVGVPPDLGH